jgi:hypothetical protein
MSLVVFQTEVVEASTLISATGELQPRDRAGRATSAAQIAELASNLDAARLRPESAELQVGAPIVGPDNVVESGNGRVAAIRLAYEKHPARAEAYREMVKAYADRVDVHLMDMPVVIRRRVTHLTQQERIAYVAAANRSIVASLAPAEQAAADAAALSLEDITESLE